MTKKLYYTDSYKTNFTEKIVNKTKYFDKFAVVLEETYFYPTTGGQEHDIGTINGVDVIDVVEYNDQILHLTQKEISGDIAECNINWKRRFDFMQQHTGQHILSESIFKIAGYNTISSHLVEESSTIDLNCNNISQKEIAEFEVYANNIIYQNLDVKIHFISDTEVDKYPLRKPPKFTGLLRIIEIDGFDFSACGGTHVKKTGEVGLIKIVKSEKIKGNATRLEFLCGQRALNDYQWKHFLFADISYTLSSSEKEIPEKVRKLINENKLLNKQIDIYKEQILQIEAEELINDAIIEKDTKIIKKVFHNRDFSDLRIIAQKIISNEGYIVLLGNINSNSNILFARSADVSINMVQLFNSISGMIDAKGGGKPDFVQAGLKNSNNLVDALNFVLRNLNL
ncbi:MAG TPA: DHHA1 domain-containing protein [Bacteroidota bacterium]|nr:DHHA1 domain-containing protein [Bacteroidota bacterium]